MPERSTSTAPGHRSPERTEPDSISSRTLFGDRKTLVIDHEGARYTLRITSNRKLILTK